MTTDFSTVRELLECAQNKLVGDDATSRQVREAIEELITEVAIEECVTAPATALSHARRRARKAA